MIRPPIPRAPDTRPTQTPPGWYCLASAALVAAFAAALVLVLRP